MGAAMKSDLAEDIEALVSIRTRIWAFVVLAILLVCLSDPIGQAIVTQHPLANDSTWDPNQAIEAKTVLQILGCFSFVYAMVERIVEALQARDDSGGPPKG